MTGYESKKKAAQAKLKQAKEILLQHPQKDIDWQREQQIKAHTKLNDDDDDTQVYKDHGVALHSIKHPPGLMDDMALTIAYQSGYYDGKKAVQPAQAPVAWMYDWFCDGKLITGWIAHSESEIPKLMASNIRPLYTTPPQRTWVDLTDDDCKGMSAGDRVVAMLVSRILKERNA